MFHRQVTAVTWHSPSLTTHSCISVCLFTTMLTASSLLELQSSKQCAWRTIWLTIDSLYKNITLDLPHSHVTPLAFKLFHPRRQNVTTFMIGFLHIHKNLTKNGEPQRYSWLRRWRRRNCSSWLYAENVYYFLEHFCVLTMSAHSIKIKRCISQPYVRGMQIILPVYLCTNLQCILSYQSWFSLV